MFKKLILLQVFIAICFSSCFLSKESMVGTKESVVGKYYKSLSHFEETDYNILATDFESGVTPKCSDPPFVITLGTYSSQESLLFNLIINDKYFSTDYKLVRVEWIVNGKTIENTNEVNLNLILIENESYKIRCRLYSADEQYVYFKDIEFNIDTLIEDLDTTNAIEFNQGNFDSGIDISRCNTSNTLKVAEGSGMTGFVAIIYP